jgi:cell division transport system permease protein
MFEKSAAATPLLPPRNMAGPALLAVTVVMTLLACLALGSTVLVDRAAERWLTRATSAVSIQIVETRSQTADEQLPAVLRELAATPGVGNFRVLDKDELIRLLEPWLGTGNISTDLPLPLLIEVSPDPTAKFAEEALRARLTAVAPGARLDTHGRWREMLERMARALRFFAGLVLVMVTLATGTVILFATRAGLKTNEDILDVLHQIGAQDSFISRRFEKHFVKLTAIASALGFLAALAFFYALGSLVPDARSAAFLVYLVCVPALAVPFSWQVTRYYVMTSLKTRV